MVPSRSKIPNDPLASIKRLFQQDPEIAIQKLRQMDFDKLKALHEAQRPLYESTFRFNTNYENKASQNAKLQEAMYMLIHQATYERTTGNLKMNPDMQNIYDFSIKFLKKRLQKKNLQKKK